MSRSWTMERRKKFLKKSDHGQKKAKAGKKKLPKAGTRKKVWVRAHTNNGRKVPGQYRKAPKRRK